MVDKYINTNRCASANRGIEIDCGASIQRHRTAREHVACRLVQCPRSRFRVDIVRGIQRIVEGHIRGTGDGDITVWRTISGRRHQIHNHFIGGRRDGYIRTLKR